MKGQPVEPAREDQRVDGVGSPAWPLGLRILQVVGESSPDFVWVLDAGRRFLYASPPLLDRWKRSLDAVLGKGFEELAWPPELADLNERRLEEAFSGKAFSGSTANPGPEGPGRRYEFRLLPVPGADGRVEAVVGTARDVSERQRAEQERASADERLRESERQFRDFADAMPQLAWIAQADGFIYWYNRRWFQYTGTTPAQMEGWGWQSVHDPATLPQVLERWRESIRSSQPFEMTFPLRGADGRFRYFLTRVNPVRNARGELTHWFGTNTDVDAQKQTLEERDAALLAARQAVQLRDDFLSIASHELRTPLAALLLTVQGLERQVAASPGMDQVRGRLARAVKSGLRLERLISELLDVSRLSSGQLRLEPERVELRPFLEEVCARIDAGDLRGRLRWTCEGSPVGHWDPLRLDQVLNNLIQNALKYGLDKPVEVEARVHGSRVAIEVRDQGIGIAPGDQERIFERFARAASTREYGGFGLGLWIVRQIVDACGGRISVESKEGQGSKFRVELPLDPGGSDGLQQDSPDRR